MSYKEDFVIEVNNLSKRYDTYKNPRDRLKQIVLSPLLRLFGIKHDCYSVPFIALDNVSFRVKRGETFGIIGKNGSGKSTLLQILCGTLSPSSGSVSVSGKVAALLELGAGFNPEFSGKDNVYMCGRLYGLSTKEIDARFNKITDFAEIGDFIDRPVKTYSSGMYVRLAFAVIAHVDADILVIDEALSVGDAYFVQKCMRFLRNFMENGTLLFVSHDISAVTNLCSNLMWLDKGSVKQKGEPREVVKKYLEDLVKQSQDIEPAKLLKQENNVEEIESGEYFDMRDKFINQSNLRNDLEIIPSIEDFDSFGAGGAKIISCILEDIDSGAPLSYLVGGEMVRLKIRAEALIDLDAVILGFDLKNRIGQTVFGDNTYLTYRLSPVNVKGGSNLVSVFDFRMPLLPAGDYAITVAIATGSQDAHIQQHWVHDILLLKVHSSRVYFGVVGIPMKNIEIFSI